MSTSLCDRRPAEADFRPGPISKAKVDVGNHSTTSSIVINQPLQSQQYPPQQGPAPRSRQSSPSGSQRRDGSNVDLFALSKGVKRKITWPENQRVTYIEDQMERERQLVREYEETRGTWKMLTTIEDAKSAAVCRSRGVQNCIRMHNAIERLQSELEEFLEEQLRRAIEVEPAMFKRMMTCKLYNQPISDADEASCDRQHELLDELMARSYQTRQSSMRFISLFLNDEEKRHIGAKVHYIFGDNEEDRAPAPGRKFVPIRIVEAADNACADLLLAREVRDEERARMLQEAKEKRESHRQRKQERKEIRLARQRRREERAKANEAKLREKRDPFNENREETEASPGDKISIGDESNDEESATFFTCASSNDESENMGEFYPIGYDDEGNSIYRRKTASESPDNICKEKRNSDARTRRSNDGESNSHLMTLPTPVIVTKGDEIHEMFHDRPWENKIMSTDEGRDGAIQNLKDGKISKNEDNCEKLRSDQNNDDNADGDNYNVNRRKNRNDNVNDAVMNGDLDALYDLSESDTSSNVPIVPGDPIPEVSHTIPDPSAQKCYTLHKEMEGELHRHGQPMPNIPPKGGDSRCSSHITHYHYYHSRSQPSPSMNRFRSPREPPRARHTVLGVELPRKYHARDPSKMYGGHQIETVIDPLTSPTRGRAASKQQPFIQIDRFDDIDTTCPLKAKSPGRWKVSFADTNDPNRNVPYLNTEALNQRLHLDMPKHTKVAAWQLSQQMGAFSPSPPLPDLCPDQGDIANCNNEKK